MDSDKLFNSFHSTILHFRHSLEHTNYQAPRVTIDGRVAMTVIQNMRLNADFSERLVVDSQTLDWHASPSPLVHRRLLERVGGEVARATSIVRYAPGAKFDAHRHELGEEIFVLEGMLSDEAGNYGPGTYLKNPLGSSHAPFSDNRLHLVCQAEPP